MSQPILFRIILGSVAVLLFGFQFLLYRRWRSRIGNRFPRLVKAMLILLILCSLYMVLYAAFGVAILPEVLDGFWLPLYYFFLSWEYAFALSLPLWLLFAVLAGLLLSGRFLLRKLTGRTLAHTVEGSATSQQIGFSRRMFLFGTAGAVADAVPVLTAGVNFSGMFLGSRQIEIMDREIRLHNLHRDLHGFRIVQISDLHVGPLIHERYLSAAASMIQSLRPDLVVVTGDVIDNNNRYLPVAALFLRRLLDVSRYGVMAISGNHDFIDDGDKAMSVLKNVGVSVLRNERALVRQGQGALQFVGLDYPHTGGRLSPGDRMQMAKEYFRTATSSLRPEIPTIVLNHHPGDFAFLRNEPIDLVLSGHTHGGQVILSDDRESPLSLASNFSSYYIDLYQENGRFLYVNRGLGHWFPLRIHCPPEISVITLL